MTAIGLCSAKGSPGVTFLASALASAGRAAGAVLVEADTAGGDLALAHGVAENPGLAQLAARAHRATTGPAPEPVADLARELGPGGARAVIAPVGSRAAESAVALLAAHAHQLAASTGPGSVFVDCGRVSAASCPAWPLLEGCDVICLVVRGDVVALGHAAVLAKELRQRACPAVFALIDTGPYRVREAAAVLDLACVGTVPYRTRRGSRALRRAVSTLHTALVNAACTSPGDHADSASDRVSDEAVSIA